MTIGLGYSPDDRTTVTNSVNCTPSYVIFLHSCINTNCYHMLALLGLYIKASPWGSPNQWVGWSVDEAHLTIIFLSQTQAVLFIFQSNLTCSYVYSWLKSLVCFNLFHLFCACPQLHTILVIVYFSSMSRGTVARGFKWFPFSWLSCSETGTLWSSTAGAVDEKWVCNRDGWFWGVHDIVHLSCST